MPRMDKPQLSHTLAKLLVVGDGKVGKTHYAAMAAKAGFRILYLDGDVGAQTITYMVAKGELTPEEAGRIYLLDIGDTIAGGTRDTKFVEFMNEFMDVAVVKWNETQQRIAKRTDPATDEMWEIRPGLMGPNDLIVLDSWTGFAESTMLWAGRANGVNVYGDPTHKLRPAYQGAGLKATELCAVIRSSPCNWIVIGHTDEYQHTTVKDGANKGQIKESDQTVDWTKMIPRSISKPHGFQMPKYFTDVAWLELSPAGNERRLDFRPRNDRVGGGHFTESKSVADYSFLKLVQEIGGNKPDPKAPMPWLKIIPPGEAVEEEKKESQVLDGTKATPIKAKGLQGLQFGKAKTPA